MLQAAWAEQQYANGDKNYGLAVKTDSLEGWIITA
jgi:hypothetical protein